MADLKPGFPRLNIARCERGCDPPRPATLLIRAGLEWHPCCAECAEWWSEDRRSYLANPTLTAAQLGDRWPELGSADDARRTHAWAREVVLMWEAEKADLEAQLAGELISRDEALWMIGTIQGDITPTAVSVRAKLLAFLTEPGE